MDYRLTDKMNVAKKSIIRGITEIAEENLPIGEKGISFAAGFPDEDVLPVSSIRKISDQMFQQKGTAILQYGYYEGDPDYRNELKKFVNHYETIYTEADDIVAAAGSSEGLFLIADAFINPGDNVIIEDPTYINAKNVFEMEGANLIGVTLHNDGVDLDELEKAMAMPDKPKFFYMIPTFGNPTGIVTSLEKRKKIYELAVNYQVPIVEDNPYGYLRFHGEAVPTIKSLDTEGAVIYAGTLSKVISPGMRTGFICCNKELAVKIQTLRNNVAGSCVNWTHFTIAEFLKTVDLDAHIHGLAAQYEKKANLMYEKMQECFHPAMRYEKPLGGMFLWVGLPEGMYSTPFCMEAAKRLHVSVVPGEEFCIKTPDQCAFMRFNYSAPTCEEIVEGIEKLGSLTYEYCEKA